MSPLAIDTQARYASSPGSWYRKQSRLRRFLTSVGILQPRVLPGIETPLHVVPESGLHIGVGTLVFILVMVITAIVAMETQSNLMFVVFGVQLAALLISPWLANRSLMSVQVERIADDRGTVGKPLTVTYRVKNVRRVARAMGIHIVDMDAGVALGGLTETYLAMLSPGEHTTLHLHKIPVQRGKISLDHIRLACRFPFGLFTRFCTISQPAKLTIYPALGRLRSRPLGRSGGRSGDASITGDMGTETEFFGVREFRIGDNPRRIHWKRSARTGEMMVREMKRYSPERIVVVLDTYVSQPYDLDHLLKFEMAVNYAATVACQSLEAGFQTMLVCTAAPPTVVPPQSGRPARHRFLQTLAQVSCQSELTLGRAVSSLRWSRTWSGSCQVISSSPESAGSASRTTLNETIGPAHILMVQDPQFNDIFVPPEFVNNSGTQRVGQVSVP